MVRRVIITGANKGIGLAIANRCLQDHNDAHVIMACRSVARGEAAAANLIAANPEWKKRILVIEMDVSSDDSVKAAAAKLKTELEGAEMPLLYGIVKS
jgi:NAD(P)-dependent dehydrogenase (short-subunit alcohol dehydrogenase family)